MLYSQQNKKKKKAEEPALDENHSYNTSDHVIKLNVGGTRFETLKSTLMRSGYFKALFSGRFADSIQKDGSYFVDRNGRIFGFLLNFLRCGHVSFPVDCLAEVAQETSFYQIELDLSAVADQLKSDLVIVRYHTVNHERGVDLTASGKGIRSEDDCIIVNKMYFQFDEPDRFLMYMNEQGYEITNLVKTARMEPRKGLGGHHWVDVIITMNKVIPSSVSVIQSSK